MAVRKNVKRKAELSKKDLLGLYTSMLRIRKVEEALMEVFSAGEIPGFLHVCVGQEAAPAAVCGLLNPDDYIGTTHRGHGHVLAKGIDLKLFMAELFGKKNGFCLGRSGSMHLADKNLGILGANGIVGGGIPITTGAALAAQYKYPKRVSICFFGDGTTDQGTFYECLNMASLWKLPIVYVCENNGWAQFTPQKVHAANTDVTAKAACHDMPTVTVPNDVLKIHKAADAAIKRARKGGGPTLVEVKCNRWHGHYVGDAQKYREKKSMEQARKDDCLVKFENELVKRKLLTKTVKAGLDKQLSREIADSIDFARTSPLPDPSELKEGLYVD